MQPEVKAMNQLVYEGTWEEIAQHAAELAGRHLRLVIVNDQKPDEVASATNSHLYFGMFPGDPEVTEDDFKLAEWRGEDIDI
jgi:hypothetical protein